MIENLDQLFKDAGQPGLSELRQWLQDFLSGYTSQCRWLDAEQLQPRRPRVFRLRFACGNEVRSLIVKRLEPGVALRNKLVVTRWLPAVGLKDRGPVLLGASADRTGQWVWHIYEDLGAGELDPESSKCDEVRAAVELIARIHTRFADHPLLPECRLYGGDFGTQFFTSNITDAMRCLKAIRPDAIGLSNERVCLRDRLLSRLQALLDNQHTRAQAYADLGGPETLLHGDLWTTNTFVLAGANGPEARLIDWDHAAVGPFSYDLSTFLLRFPRERRRWILDEYCKALAIPNWRMPQIDELNLLFETAELARIANRIIWPAIAIVLDRAEWGFDELAEVERWFDDLEPVLSVTNDSESIELVER